MCNITFGGAVAQPTVIINVFGSNTNTVPVPVTIVADPLLSVPATALISIDNNGLTQTIVNVTNESTIGSVTGVSATLPPAWNGIVQLDDSQCANLLPNTFCPLFFSSAIPFLPVANIPITATSDIGNAPVIAIAFTSGSGGDLVYDLDTTNQIMSLVANADNSAGIPWGPTFFIAGIAQDPNNGAQNTQSIVAYYGDGNYAAANCAAFNGSGMTGWFLPAINQTGAMYTNLLNVSGTGINFGNFQTSLPYWSSTNVDFPVSMVKYFSTGVSADQNIFTNYPVRCARTATYPVPEEI